MKVQTKKCCITSLLFSIVQTYKMLSKKYIVLFFLLMQTHSQDVQNINGFEGMMEYAGSRKDTESHARSGPDLLRMTKEVVSL